MLVETHANMSLGIVNFGVQAEFLPDEVADAMRQLSIERQDRRTVQAASHRHDATLSSPKEKRPPLLLHRVPAEVPRLTARVTEFNIREHLRPDADSKKKSSEKYELYVMYTVRVEKGDGHGSTIYRRYNDFELLHEQLPSSVKNCASFPARRFWARLSGSRFSNKSLEGRRQALNAYLGVLCDVACDLPILNLFLSDAWLKIRKPYHATGQATTGRYIVARNRRLMASAKQQQNQPPRRQTSPSQARAQPTATNARIIVSSPTNGASAAVAAGPSTTSAAVQPQQQPQYMVHSLGGTSERFVTAASVHQTRRAPGESSKYVVCAHGHGGGWAALLL